MTILLIVGTSPSKLAAVETLLYSAGLEAANASRREAFSPQQIDAKLLEACNHDTQNFTQLTPGNIWQTLVSDLLIANTAHSLWGWADKDAICLLDYWKEIDQGIKFVLVYDDLATELPDQCGAATLTPERLTQIEAMWCSANTALLGFYNRNKQRSILVHGKQALLDQAAFLSALSTQLGLDELHTAPHAEPMLATDDCLRKLSSALLSKGKELPYLYEEMQASAALPLQETDSMEEFDAWNRQQVLLNEHPILQQENQFLIPQLHNVQEELEHYYLMAEELRRPYNALIEAERIKAQLSYRLGATMLIHSRSIIGWLSMPWALIVQAQQFAYERRKALPKPGTPPTAEQVKQHLSYRLGATLIAHSKTLSGWMQMPFALKREIAAFNKAKKPTQAL